MAAEPPKLYNRKERKEKKYGKAWPDWFFGGGGT